MPDINNQIVFSESEMKTIKEKLGSDSFNHNEWGLEDSLRICVIVWGS